MTVKDCGRTRGCFRSCTTEPNCPTDQVDYILTMDTSNSDSSIGSNEVLFKLGGKLLRQKEVWHNDMTNDVIKNHNFKKLQNFIGLGLGKDYHQMRNTDIFVCTREGEFKVLRNYKNMILKWPKYSGNRIDGSHYLLENDEGSPQVHRASIDLTTFGVDEETGFAYCAFVRWVSIVIDFYYYSIHSSEAVQLKKE